MNKLGKVGLGLGLGLIIRRIAMTATADKPTVEWGNVGLWHFPVPDVKLGNTKFPSLISQEFKPGRHRGVDVMFARTAASRAGEYPPFITDIGGARAGAKWFAPVGTPILAARAGRVWSVGQTATGITIVLDHGAPWATAYFHLASTSLPKHEHGKMVVESTRMAPAEVKAGDQIGTMGHNPNKDPKKGAVDAELLRHLHFETWYKGGNSNSSVDPGEQMKLWKKGLWVVK